jgi:hypothetical protein
MDTTADGLLFLLLDGYHCWWTIIPIAGWIPLLVDYYSYCWMDTTAGELLFPDGISHPVVSVSSLTWLFKYIYY